MLYFAIINGVCNDSRVKFNNAKDAYGKSFSCVTSKDKDVMKDIISKSDVRIEGLTLECYSALDITRDYISQQYYGEIYR